MIRFLKIVCVLVYMVLLIYTVFLARRRNGLISRHVEENLNYIPFRSIANNFYDNIIHGDSIVKRCFFISNVFGNILLFAPFPILCCFVGFKWSNGSILIAGMLLSFLIEVIQGVFTIGIPDVDDILLNTLGVCFGIWGLILLKIK